MTQRLHLVFGGELIDPTKNAFKDVNDIHIVGMFCKGTLNIAVKRKMTEDSGRMRMMHRNKGDCRV